MSIILFEIFRYLFTVSIIFILYKIGEVALKAYSNFVLGIESKFILTDKAKIMLMLALGIIITFLTKSFTI